MVHRVYKTLDDFMDDLSDDHRIIVDSLRALFLCHEWVTESIKRDCLHFNFPNGMWCYLNCRKKKYPELGFSRGAWMVKNYPLLSGLFDELKAVVGKFFLKDVWVIEEKWMKELIAFVYGLPKGIGAKYW